jgi:nucleotide-binding universal stress UspA family protein
MPLFHHILFPVDFSKRCHAVAPAVKSMAIRSHAALSLLHTFELPIVGYGDPYAYLPEILTEFRDASTEAMDKFRRQYFEVDGKPADSLKVEAIVQAGAPVESIAEYVGKSGVDLVMLPSHGRGRFRSLLLGSVTSGVLHDVHCPVWTATHCEETTPSPEAYSTVLCAIDLKPNSVDTLRVARQIASENKANLVIVYAEPAIDEFVHSATATRFRRFLEFRAKEDFEPLAQQANVASQLEVITGPVGESIANAARNHHADALVVGRGVIEERFGRLRTGAYDIIRTSPCPVFSV